MFEDATPDVTVTPKDLPAQNSAAPGGATLAFSPNFSTLSASTNSTFDVPVDPASAKAAKDNLIGKLVEQDNRLPTSLKSGGPAIRKNGALQVQPGTNSVSRVSSITSSATQSSSNQERDILRYGSTAARRGVGRLHAGVDRLHRFEQKHDPRVKHAQNAEVKKIDGAKKTVSVASIVSPERRQNESKQRAARAGLRVAGILSGVNIPLPRGDKDQPVLQPNNVPELTGRAPTAAPVLAARKEEPAPRQAQPSGFFGRKGEPTARPQTTYAQSMQYRQRLKAGPAPA